MTGQDLVRLVQQQLAEKDIPKGEFYKACGITSTAFSNWRNGANTPSAKNTKVILDYLGINVEDVFSRAIRSIERMTGKTEAEGGATANAEG